MGELAEVHERILACTDCPLHLNRTQAVPGEGSPVADLMLIGEAPGFHEDRHGRPFVGPAGQILNGLLASIGLQRRDVFITNMIKCRPQANRDPSHGEIEACSKHLDAQIRLIRPKVIGLLGRHALAKWFPGESIGKARAKARRVDSTIFFPMYHPAAALHNPGLKATIELDFRQIAGLLKETDVAAADHGSGGEQLSMF